MLIEYFILLLFAIIASVLCLAIPLFSTSIVFQENYQEKISSYECGFEPFERYMQPFEVRYYLIAILFLLFDLEIVFLMP
jgi:NADH-quinone oxidoreductase subunit A